MHELSIAMSLLEVAADEAERQGGGTILAIHLQLGPLSGVVKAALHSAFEVACAGREMEGCKLLIEEMPIMIDCPTCLQPRPARSVQEICCRECGTPTMKILGGRELEVTALELGPIVDA